MNHLVFIQTNLYSLEAFEEVVQTCFGFEYNEQYEEKIEFFEKRWMPLKEEFGITVPNKCHIIFTHVKDYIFSHKISLGSLSEQVVEACHSKWIKLWESSYKIRNLDSELYGERLLSCLLSFNSRNI